jgi:RNA polymerase sigma factor (sigma-70 family)
MTFQTTINKITDEELIQQIIKTNDTHLFGLLYDRYVSIVYNKCLSFISSKEDAQDLTHDIFVKLFVKLKTYKGDSKFSTWMYAFTYNHCINHLQREVKGDKNTFSLKEEVEDQLMDEISDNQIFELKAEKLTSSLQLIKPDERALLLMKYQDDLTIKEIADLNNLGESAVKMRLNRAKANLLNIYQNM